MLVTQVPAAAVPGGGGSAAPSSSPPLTPDTVLQWVGGALSPDGPTRSAAERALALAEDAASPGYLSSLLDIVLARETVAEVRCARCER